MSKRPPLDHDYNMDLFVELLKKAQVKRKQKEFAEALGMNKTYLNMFFNKKVYQPPTPKFLKKIAAASENRVSYEEFLESAGYDAESQLKQKEKYQFTENEGIIPLSLAAYEKLEAKEELEKATLRTISGIITNSLAQEGFKWSGVIQMVDRLPLHINLYDLPISEWGFCFLVDKVEPFEYHFTGTYEELLGAFGLELLDSVKPNEKLSFVTTSREVFKNLLSCSFPLLALYISAIWVEPTEMCVLQEEYLKTYLTDNDNLPRLR